MYIVHRMVNRCCWSCDQITELHLNIAQAPLRCLPGSWTHQSSTDQCRGRKGDMKRKPHSTKYAPLRGTQPTSYSDCSSGPLMLLYTTGITSTACKTKVTWVATWIGALCPLHQADIWLCSLSHNKETFKI